MKKFFIVIFLFFAVKSVFCQTDSIPLIKTAEKVNEIILPDSTELQKHPFDSARGQRLKKVTANLYSSFKKVVGIDTFTVQEKPKVVFWRSMVIPGMGQLMNHDYWKLPVIYASAVGGGMVIAHHNKNYKKYLDIVEDMYFNHEETRPMIDGGYPIDIKQYARAAAQFKRWRDFSRISFGLGWTLFAVEANVAAHLKNFDISDDISLKIQPAVIPANGDLAGGINLSFNFK